jgi:Leucine-rich repeat (LRR) protein
MADPSPDLIALLKRARRGSIDIFNDQGEEGSAQWGQQQQSSADNDEQAHQLLRLPACLLLNDLDIGILPTDFGTHAIFASVTELDLSGNRLHGDDDGGLPYDMFTSNLKQLRVLYLGGPGPKFTPEGALCNMLSSIPSSIGNLTSLEHLSLHDNNLSTLPEEMYQCNMLHTLRLDRNPIQSLPSKLPQSLRVLHLEGCPLPGTLDNPDKLPISVLALAAMLDDLLLPDGCHVGIFFDNPLSEMLTATATNDA